MSLHAIFTFHELTKSVPPSVSVARERETDSPRHVISATWRATADTLRASLSLEEQLGSSVEMT